MIVNMLVDLSGASLETPDEPALLAAANVQLFNRQGGAAEDLDWIRKTFRGRWRDEAEAGWNWFAHRDGRPLGFATYEQRRFRWWWLERWWDRKDVGIFGPMGVDPELRGKHLGVILARRALASMQTMGFTKALIPAAGPTDFYERYCGARIVEKLPWRL